jgi:TRAP-type C4-dicarboxylate transport system substrate-binding protein
MKRYLLFSLTFLQLLAVFASAASASEKLTLIHPGSPGSLYEISALEFARRLGDKLPEPYTIAVAANTGLGDGLSLLDSVKNGRATFALASSGLVALSDSFAIFEMPFLFRSREQIRAIREALLDPYLEPAAQKHGLHILGVWENGFRHFTNDDRTIRTPADFKDLRIAAPPANIWRLKLLRAYGARPVPMSQREFSRALGRTSVDGQEAPLLQIASLNLPEMQHHLALSDHLYSPAFLIAESAAFAELPPEIRTLIADEAKAIESWIQEIAIRVESDLIDRLDQSMQMSHINRAAFVSASRPLYSEFIAAVPDGAKMIAAIKSYPVIQADGINLFLQSDKNKGSN